MIEFPEKEAQAFRCKSSLLLEILKLTFTLSLFIAVRRHSLLSLSYSCSLESPVYTATLLPVTEVCLKKADISSILTLVFQGKDFV